MYDIIIPGGNIMEEKSVKPETISYYDHEEQIARSEAHLKRWAIAALIAFIALILTNAGWIIYEAQYQDVVTETFTSETDQGGDALNVIAKDKATLNYGDKSDLQQDKNSR
jgi:hypothetical protein